MAKKRSRQQKIKIAQKRSQVYSITEVEQVGGGQTKSPIEQPKTKVDSAEILGFDFKLIRADLAKTLIISSAIMAVLLILKTVGI